MIRKNYKPLSGWYITTAWDRKKKCWQHIYHKTKSGADWFWKNKVEVNTVYDVYRSRQARFVI